MPDSSGAAIHLRTVTFKRRIWRANFLRNFEPNSVANDIVPISKTPRNTIQLMFVTFAESALDLYSLSFDTSPKDALTLKIISRSRRAPNNDRNCWRFCVGSTGHRVTWLAEEDGVRSHEPPSLTFSFLDRISEQDREEVVSMRLGFKIDTS